MIIKDKAQMYEMLRAGLFGNTLRTWDTEEAYLASGYKGRTSLRCKQPGITFRHGLSHEEVLVASRECFEGCEPKEFIFCESAPDWAVIIQGEVQRTWGGLTLTWSQAKSNNREAMRNGPAQSYGLKAKLLMMEFMDPASYEDVMELLELYQDHVVEFSTFSVSLGSIPGRNTVIWEVRNY